jgi:hypothetical protein
MVLTINRMPAINTVKASDFTPKLISKPSLCLSCKKNDIEEWDDENLCCLMKEMENETEEFFCQSYEPLW